MRLDNRKPDQIRPIRIIRHYTRYATGSVLIECGETKVICSVSVKAGVPSFLRNKNEGWLTAEYGMLPCSTHSRMSRDSNGRIKEIQRLISRSLRAIVNRKLMGENTIMIDCDVIQADGGTRTAAITGAYVALVDAVQTACEQGKLKSNPIQGTIAAVSVGIVKGEILLDLNYEEDSQAQTDMNIVMNKDSQFIEIQGTAESQPFTLDQLNIMLEIGRQGITELFEHQHQALAQP